MENQWLFTPINIAYFELTIRKKESTFCTQFQKVLKNLDIELICAHDPQAKGRIKSANGILQDRFVKELKKIIQRQPSIEEAHEYLETFRLKYNKKFFVSPANKKNAHRNMLTSQKYRKYLHDSRNKKIS